MSTTLTNGLKLPDKGSVDWYADMQNNYTILDGAVGTVAEHTSQIAGKAPAVHTHTKADITDFPAYGNTAGTICEGNDSRLSDARTPVAHTHTKSDVTDLFNSANVWTGRQTYGAYLKSFGEARTDEWSGNSRTNAYLLSRRDTDDVSGFLISTFRSNQAQGTAGHIYGWDILENSTRYSGLRFTIDWDSTLNSGNGAYRVTLGTNTQGTNPCNDLHITQLKTINGLNPGALSLPGAYQGINDQIKNPSDQLNAIDLNGGSNTWVSDVDCYLYFYIPNNKFTWIRIFWPATLVRCGQTFVPVPNESSDYSGFVPVPANTTVVIQIKGTQAPIFRRSACLGNV